MNTGFQKTFYGEHHLLHFKWKELGIKTIKEKP